VAANAVDSKGHTGGCFLKGFLHFFFLSRRFFLNFLCGSVPRSWDLGGQIDDTDAHGGKTASGSILGRSVASTPRCTLPPEEKTFETFFFSQQSRRQGVKFDLRENHMVRCALQF
jgi:hypothetical protein